MKQSFIEWLFTTCDWRVSSGAMKSKRYSFDAFPAQLDMVKDESPQQSIIKSAQMAVSEHYSLARPFYYMDVHKVNWGVLFPTQGAMRDFFRTRIKNAISANPYIKRHVTAENESNIAAFGRELYLRYTTTESAIATFDADGITVDEQDLHKADMLYGVRTSRTQGAMREPRWYDVSTPSFPKFGIHQAYLNSDQMVWLIRCGVCGYENDLTTKLGAYDIADIQKFFTEFLPDDRDGAWKDYFIPCSRCGKKIDTVTPLDLAKPSLGGGRWVARYPDRAARGYHLQIFQRVYEKGFAQVLQRVRKNLYDATKPEHVRRWWNFTLGVPYVPTEGRLTDEALNGVTTFEYEDRWRSDIVYKHIRMIDRMDCDWLGIDVRDRQYHLFGLKRLGDRKLVCLVGWVETSGEARAVWERVGRPVFAIDAQPDTNDSRALVRAMGKHRAFRGKFGKGLNTVYQQTAEDQLYSINRPRAMEAVKYAIDEARSWVVPDSAWGTGAGIYQTRGSEKYEETLKDHFKAPVLVKVEDEITGNDQYDFPQDAMGGVDPHFFMAACLAYIAAEVQPAPASVIVIPR